MSERTPVQFRHRMNREGCYESICLRCFRTVGTEQVETDLLANELLHVCMGFNMDKMFYPQGLK